MKRLFVPGLILLVTMALVPSIVVPRITAAKQDVDCTAITQYLSEVYDTYDPETELQAAGLNIDLVDTWTSTDFTIASDIMEDIRTDLEGLSPPPDASILHSLLLQRIGATSQMFDSLAAVGLFGALGYMDTIDSLDAQIDDAVVSLELECNFAIFDNDDDGVPEIGRGNSAIEASVSENSTTEGVSGTRANPLSIGTTARLSDDWEVTITGVLPDATEYVLSENQFNDPPDAGERYFIAAVTVSYVGNTSARFSSSRLNAVGQSSVAYEEYEDDCGELPNELEDREIFSGGSITGNICWSVSEDDIDSLALYYSDSDDEDRIFLSLVPSTSADLLATPISETTAATPASTPELMTVATPLEIASPIPPASPEAISAVEATPKIVVSTNAITDAIDAAVSNAGTPFVKVSPELDAKDIAFVPTELTISAADEPVTIKMVNTGAALHNFSIDSLDIDVDVNPGETVDVVIPAGTAPGTYDFYCNVPGHKEAGMVGKLTVN